MKAVLIPGDGIGREIAESVRAVSAALNTGIEWQEVRPAPSTPKSAAS